MEQEVRVDGRKLRQKLQHWSFLRNADTDVVVDELNYFHVLLERD